MPMDHGAILRRVETELAAFYGFEALVNVEQCLVQSMPQERRGCVFVHQPAVDELELGIGFADHILATLTDQDPFIHLSETNLDAFCVVVEEISHLHLIANRAAVDRRVSQLELEWQGEIDKLIMCARLLHDQSGDAHLLPLARRLYDLAQIFADDSQRYWEATKFAARFWYSALATGDRKSLPEPVAQALRRLYFEPWHEKVTLIEDSRAA